MKPNLKNDKTHLLIDVNNLFYRAAYRTSNESPDDRIPMAFDFVIRSINFAFNDFSIDHVVFAFEGGSSWRRTIYPEYKSARREKVKTKKEIALIERMNEAIEHFKKFLIEDTNVSVLHANNCEGDDVIARWTQIHPNTRHIIMSSDGDFKQLMTDRIVCFDPMQQKLWTYEGVFFRDDIRMKNDQLTPIYNSFWKVNTTLNPEDYDPDWQLFYKIMRGDVGDSVPRAAIKRTSIKVIRAAFDNPENEETITFFENKRTDLKEDVTVQDVATKNNILVNLRNLPSNIISIIDPILHEQKTKKPVARVGIRFMSFCRDWHLVRLGQQAVQFSKPFEKIYIV